MDWTRILAYVTGTVDQELLARNEYLAAENRILKSQLNGRLKLSDAERAMLGGRSVIVWAAKPLPRSRLSRGRVPSLAWYRKLVAGKFDGSKARRGPRRPRVTREVEQLIVRIASENRDWGYDRIVGALANLGYVISDQTVGNILHRHALPPAPERQRTTTWPAFIRTHLALLAGTDFGGGADAARAGDLLRAFFHPSGEPPGRHRRHHHSPGRAVDAADCPERDHRGMRHPARLSLSPARSGYQIHPVVPGYYCVRSR